MANAPFNVTAKRRNPYATILATHNVLSVDRQWVNQGTNQSSTTKFGTRENSPTLLVTKVNL